MPSNALMGQSAVRSSVCASMRSPRYTTRFDELPSILAAQRPSENIPPAQRLLGGVV
ncbi:DUF4113 domain-containing protein [Methylobacterium sp. WL69]|nr:DUF4113 domain-containing protein [Methylobacterium sp. WL69]